MMAPFIHELQNFLFLLGVSLLESIFLFNGVDFEAIFKAIELALHYSKSLSLLGENLERFVTFKTLFPSIGDWIRDKECEVR